MSPTILSVIALRSAALALSISGDAKGASVLYALADLVSAGVATDEHMRAVADKLKAGSVTSADWDDVEARIKADRDRLHN